MNTQKFNFYLFQRLCGSLVPDEDVIREKAKLNGVTYVPTVNRFFKPGLV